MLGGGVVSHTIFKNIISIENLLAAWQEFKRGKISKVEVQEFQFNLEDNLFAVHEELMRKTYRPHVYAFFYVRDPKLRPIHKATVRDRVVFQAVFRILYHIFDKKFIHDSYSCRFDKGTHAGVRRLEQFLKKASNNYRGPVFALKCDVKKFFYSINHAILFNLIQKEIQDADTLDLIFKIINSFHTESGKGLPLGNVTSQLFANIYLNELDQYAKHVLKAKYYIRYCDDFIIVDTNPVHLSSLIPQINTFLQNRLHLFLHPQKIEIRKLSRGIDFLGYVTLPYYRVLRTTTKRRMFKKLKRGATEQARGLRTATSLEQALQSYCGVLKHCSGYALKEKLLKEVSVSSLSSQARP